MLRCLNFVALVLFLACPLPVRAQVSSSGLIDLEAARQVGLERMWFTQVGLDRGKNRVAGIHLHVSGTKATTIFEINHNGKRYVFSERERDAFGQMVGVDGARIKANSQINQIKADLEAAGVKDPKLPKIDVYVVPEINLYASSERGMVHGLDAETGRTLWTVAVGNPKYPTTAPCASDTHVSVINGSTIYCMRAEDGSVEWSRVVAGAPGAGPAMSEEFIFAPMIGGQIEVYDVAKYKRPPSVYRSFGLPLVQPVVSLNSVAWPTDEGNLYVGFAHVPGLRYRVEAKDAITSAPAFLAPDKVFATSLDGYIYCIHEQRGHVLWRFTTGEPISHSPIALGDSVFAITDRGNMYAIRVADAQERWLTSGIRKYLAGNDSRLYCLDIGGNLVILDTQSGSRIGAINAATLDLTLLNSQTDRIILGTSAGVLQCFRESQIYWPVVHFLTDPKKKKPAQGNPAAVPAGVPAPMPAADPFAAPAADPFAAPAAPAPAPADPFAAPAAAPAPPMPMPPPVDPFADPPK